MNLIKYTYSPVKSKYILPLLLFLSAITHAQNLITNGNFENAHSDTVNWSHTVFNNTSIPGMSIVNIHDVCAYWGKYSNCAHVSYTKMTENRDSLIEHNFCASVVVGGFTRNSTQPRRQYLQGKLCTPLKKDSIYIIECRIKNLNDDIANQLYVCFSNTEYDTHDVQFFQKLPSLTNNGEFIKDTAWTNRQITYKAHGGEQFVVFANFHDDKHTHIKLDAHHRNSLSAFMIDDICIYQDGTDKNKNACENTAY